MKMLSDKKGILALTCTSIVSMAVGILVGCMKEKMCDRTRCIIDDI